MAYYAFDVKEVIKGSLISWEAAEEGYDHVIPLHKDGYLITGSYPEIAAHLSGHHAVVVDLSYNEDLHDKFDGETLTWTFLRDGHEIVIRDIRRTVARLTGFTP